VKIEAACSSETYGIPVIQGGFKILNARVCYNFTALYFTSDLKYILKKLDQLNFNGEIYEEKKKTQESN